MGDEKKAAPAEAEAVAKPEEPPKSFWLVIVKDASDVPPTCVRCSTEEAPVSEIEERVLSSDTPLHAFAFAGQRIVLSSPRPVCSFKVGDKKFDVGRESDEYDEGGRIVPLSKPGAGE